MFQFSVLCIFYTFLNFKVFIVRQSLKFFRELRGLDTPPKNEGVPGNAGKKDGGRVSTPRTLNVHFILVFSMFGVLSGVRWQI